MKIEFTEGRPAATSDINRLQDRMQLPLSADFIDFVRIHDGAKPARNRFRISEADGSSSIQRFIPVAEIPAEMKDMHLPPNTYPIAYDSSGNYIVIDEGNSGAVLFWDHEIENGTTKLSSGFLDFLNLLEPIIEPPVIKTGRAHVLSKHPDFEKIFAKYLIPNDRNKDQGTE